jgi:hypothetical protein
MQDTLSRQEIILGCSWTEHELPGMLKRHQLTLNVTKITMDTSRPFTIWLHIGMNDRYQGQNSLEYFLRVFSDFRFERSISWLYMFRNVILI